MEELSKLSLEQRQSLTCCAGELDYLPLSPADDALAEQRLAAHHARPESSVPLEEKKSGLRSRSVVM